MRISDWSSDVCSSDLLHRRREFVARLAESRQRLNRSVRVVEERTRLAWNALLSARQRLKALRAQVEANERVRVAYRQQFDIGQRSQIGRAACRGRGCPYV